MRRGATPVAKIVAYHAPTCRGVRRAKDKIRIARTSTRCFRLRRLHGVNRWLVDTDALLLVARRPTRRSRPPPAPRSPIPPTSPPSASPASGRSRSSSPSASSPPRRPDRDDRRRGVHVALDQRAACRARRELDHHRDPFDRLLIAQAMTERMPIMTSDTSFTATTSKSAGEAGGRLEQPATAAGTRAKRNASPCSRSSGCRRRARVALFRGFRCGSVPPWPAGRDLCHHAGGRRPGPRPSRGSRARPMRLPHTGVRAPGTTVTTRGAYKVVLPGSHGPGRRPRVAVTGPSARSDADHGLPQVVRVLGSRR